MLIEINGRSVRVPKRLGKALIQMHRARKKQTHEVRAVEPEEVTEPAEQPRKKRQYRRRDMQAE